MRVWVIEMKNVQSGRWEPCADASLTKRDAEKKIRDYWKFHNKCHNFRIMKYVRMEDE